MTETNNQLNDREFIEIDTGQTIEELKIESGITGPVEIIAHKAENNLIIKEAFENIQKIQKEMCDKKLQAIKAIEDEYRPILKKAERNYVFRLKLVGTKL